MIKQDIERGPYKTVDEFVERAVFLLHEQEAWLAEQGSEIRAKIEGRLCVRARRGVDGETRSQYLAVHAAAYEAPSPAKQATVS
jgi:Arc/MetJ-type ribon-helix-helix transcriptional regulator